MRVLVTGGCGFIGSNFINYLLRNFKTVEVVNMDKMTYAGLGKNIEHMGLECNPRYKFVKGDICDESLVETVLHDFKPTYIFNFAAESHVDRSIHDSSPFRKTNIDGTVTLLESARKISIEKFIQISTDEVYGSINHGSFSENDKLGPRSPYAATKAAAELLAQSYLTTHGIPLIITRSANNYGPFQFPEKLLPLFITNLIDGKKVPLMWSKENPGLNTRDWLHVEDNCRAIWLLSQKGILGEIYNIPGKNEKTNLDITKKLLSIFDFGEEMIEKIPHRLGHDFRYSINGDKLRVIGFNHRHTNLDHELELLIDWYKKNESWWRPLKDDSRS